MRLRRAWILAAVFATGLLCAVLVARPLVRGRVRREFESRCGRLVDGACSAGEIEIARDGIVLRDVHVSFRPAPMTARVAFAATTLSWWSALLGRDQDVRVVADGIRVADPRGISDTVDELARLRRRRQAAGASRGHVRVASLRLDGVAVSLGADSALRASLSGGGVEWSAAEGLHVEWTDARANVERGSVRSGRCQAWWPSGTREDRSLRCESPRLELDVNDVDAIMTALRPLDAAVRSLAQAQRDGADVAVGTSPAASPASQPMRVSARDGSIRLVRGAALIVDLSPAEVSLEIAGGIRRVHARIGGGEGATRGPDLSLDFEREAGEQRWHADVDGADLPLVEIARWLPVVPWHATENGRVRVRMRAEPAEGTVGALVVDGQVAVESFGLFHSGLAHDPIDNLTVTVEGAARFDLQHRRVETEGVRATVNGVGFAIAGWAERPAAHELAFDASLRVPTTECDGIRRALPASVTGPVDEMTFSGSIGADLHLALDTRALSATQLDVDIDDRCNVVRDNMMLGIRRTRGVFVQRVTEPTGVRAFVTGPGSAAWVPLPQISPYVTRALLVREDGAFYRHHGFNPSEIRGAIIRNVAARRFVYGASTISMQLAKNIFLQREKTLVRKLQEVVLTWYLERSLDKDSIVELYLNVVEFGPGIYGIGPAARFFFGREPADLTPLQAAYLATLLPNPVARFSNYQRGTVSSGMLGALRAVVRRMAAQSYLSTEEAGFAQNESIVFRPENVPVRGALTETVDVTTTDEMAQQMAPPATETLPRVEADGSTGDSLEETTTDGDEAREPQQTR